MANKKRSTPTKAKESKIKRGKRRDSTSESDEDILGDDQQEFTDSVSENEELQNERSDRKRNKKRERLPKVKVDPEKSNKETQQNTKGQKNISFIFVYLIPVILLFAASKLFLNSESGSIDIESRLEELRNDFQKQSVGSFRKLKRRLLPYVRHRTSPQPFVLMIASTQDGQLTAECFARRVAQVLATSSLIINGSTYSAEAPDEAKSNIDDRLRSVFRKGRFPTTAVIHNLDSIPYGTTSLFYAYCDHDNPMYNEAAIIFTITLPGNYQIGSEEIDREMLVEQYLSQDSPWVKDKSFSMDVMGALISRITDTVIVVNTESKEVLEKSC